nr:immunoglobulin heavy chain junction region [Macaca mulatta]
CARSDHGSNFGSW